MQLSLWTQLTAADWDALKFPSTLSITTDLSEITESVISEDSPTGPSTHRSRWARNTGESSNASRLVRARKSEPSLMNQLDSTQKEIQRASTGIHAETRSGKSKQNPSSLNQSLPAEELAGYMQELAADSEAGGHRRSASWGWLKVRAHLQFCYLVSFTTAERKLQAVLDFLVSHRLPNGAMLGGQDTIHLLCITHQTAPLLLMEPQAAPLRGGQETAPRTVCYHLSTWPSRLLEQGQLHERWTYVLTAKSKALNYDARYDCS